VANQEATRLERSQGTPGKQVAADAGPVVVAAAVEPAASVAAGGCNGDDDVGGGTVAAAVDMLDCIDPAVLEFEEQQLLSMD